MRRVFDEYTTGQFTKQQVLQRATDAGLRNRRGRPLSSQAIGMLLRNQLYAGVIDVARFGARGTRGDFDPLISEETFYRVQAVLSGRTPSTAPRALSQTRISGIARTPRLALRPKTQSTRPFATAVATRYGSNDQRCARRGARPDSMSGPCSTAVADERS